MRVKDFIKMLEETDPTGEGFIMMSDGEVPHFFQQKPGYYDGAYSYLTEDGRMIRSTKENKVDTYSRGIDYVVWEDLDWAISKKSREYILAEGKAFMIDKEYWFEQLKTYFVFDESIPQTEKEEFFQKVRKEYDHWFNYKVESDKKWVDSARKEHEEGVRFFQAKKKDEHGWDTWREIHKDGTKDGVCFGMIDALAESGSFSRVDHDPEWWEWIPV